MNTAHIIELADRLASKEETTLGPSDSRVAAAALLLVAGIVCNEALLKLVAANDNMAVGSAVETRTGGRA